MSLRRSHRTIHDARMLLPVLGPLEMYNECTGVITDVRTSAGHCTPARAWCGGGTMFVRFSPIRCNGQTASDLYTPSPSHSPDGIWTLATSSPGAAGAGFYTIVATSQRSRVHGFSFDGDARVPVYAFLFYRTKHPSVLHANLVRSRKFLVVFFASSHLCDAYHAIRMPCDAGSISFS
ncbi:hypothetical protein BJ912DRAFT_1149393 [Pholiota molesta]|nr:hypothetical protein BJ912DRAFT_1149393 [Pholiota molesta]